MAVLAEICAEAGRFPVDMDGFDQAVADHRLEAIVYVASEIEGIRFWARIKTSVAVGWSRLSISTS